MGRLVNTTVRTRLAKGLARAMKECQEIRIVRTVALLTLGFDASGVAGFLTRVGTFEMLRAGFAARMQQVLALETLEAERLTLQTMSVLTQEGALFQLQ